MTAAQKCIYTSIITCFEVVPNKTKADKKTFDRPFSGVGRS